MGIHSRRSGAGGSVSGDRRSTRTHAVKPRHVWSGLAAAIAGASLLGLGLSVDSPTWAATGSGVLAVGAAVAVRGGILRDAFRTSPVGAELRHVLRGTERPGVVPGEMVHNPAAERAARAATRTTAALEAERHAAATPPWSPAAGWVLLLVTLVLVGSQWELVAHNATGRSNSYRDTGLAILVGLAGLRFALSPGRHVVAGAIAAVAGAGLVLGGLLAVHDDGGLVVVEGVCGALTLVAVIAGWAGRRSVRLPAPDTVGGGGRSKPPAEAVAEGATTYPDARRPSTTSTARSTHEDL